MLSPSAWRGAVVIVYPIHPKTANNAPTATMMVSFKTINPKDVNNVT